MALALLQNPKKNRLLAAMPPVVWARIAPHLELVSLVLGDQLFAPGEAIESVYFPTSVVISFLQRVDSQTVTGMALAGNEAIIGVNAFLGGDAATELVTVQMTGTAFRMDAQVLMAEFGRATAFARLALRYTNAFLVQISYTGACERVHHIEQRLVRWLLLSADRANSDDLTLTLTQDALADLLGVRREGVNLAAVRLQESGLIKYSRGNIMVVDRPGLEMRACSCYREIKAEYERFLSAIASQ